MPKKSARRFPSAPTSRAQQIGRRLLVGESTASIGREFDLSDNEIERLRRRLEVDLTVEEDGSAALRRRQTLFLEGLLDTALGAWRTSGGSAASSAASSAAGSAARSATGSDDAEAGSAGDAKFLNLARQTLQDLRKLWRLGEADQRQARRESSASKSADEEKIVMYEDPGWFGETELFKKMFPHINYEQANNNGNHKGNGNGNGKHHDRRAGDGR